MCDFGQQVVLCKSLRDTSGRLAELGWLHNKVRKYTDARSLDRAFGLVGQVCFCVYALPLILCFFSHQIFKNVFSSFLRVFVLHCIRSLKSTTGYCLSSTLRYTYFMTGLVNSAYRTAVWRQIYSGLNWIPSVLQLQVEDDQGMSMCPESSLTLRRLLVWMYDPKVRLKTLAALVDFCQGEICYPDSCYCN